MPSLSYNVRRKLYLKAQSLFIPYTVTQIIHRIEFFKEDTRHKEQMALNIGFLS